MITPETLALYNATIAPITHRSGHQAFVELDGVKYSVGTLYCNCADIEIALYANGRETDGNLQAIYGCALCGVHTTASATRCTTPAERREVDPTLAVPIFGWAERDAWQRVKKSHIPTWGFSGVKHE